MPEFVGKITKVSGAAGFIRSTYGDISYNHATLLNRDAPNQHSIAAITGLQDELDAIDAIGTERDEAIAGRVAVQQGSGNAGKALVVGNDGNVTTGDAGIPDAVKVSLLNLVRHVVYTDDQGQSYYDALYVALYSNIYPRITAMFNAGSNTVYTDDALNSLKQYMTVTYYETAQSAGTTVAANDYTLSGTLVEGENTIVVQYNSLTATVIVPAVDFYNVMHWNSASDSEIVFSTGIIDSAKYQSDVNNTVELKPYSTSLPRLSMCANRGASPVLDTSEVETEYYPIPIPANATTMRVTWPDTNYKIGVRQLKYVDQYIFSFVADSAWQTGGSYELQIATHETIGKADRVIINVQKGSNQPIAGDTPTIDIQFIPDGYPRLQVSYAPGTHTVYTDDNLDTLREYLTVKQVESPWDSGTLVTDYTLSGTLKLGDSAITIRRGSLTTEVQINARYALRQTNNDFLIQHNTSGYLEGIGANIYLDTVSSKDTTRRRIVSGSGSVPYVYYQSGGTPSESEYYPIPIPSEANYIKVTTTTGLELGFRFMKLENGVYQSYAIPASGFNAVPVERYFDNSSDLYMLLYIKKSNDTAFDSASEPTGTVIEFGVENFYNISEWNYPGNLVKVQGAASSLGSSPNYTPSIIKPSSGSVLRNTVVVNHGSSGMDSVHWRSGSDTDNGPSGYYFVPIPIDCNNVSFVCDPSSYYASVRVWHYDGNNNWTRKSESGWQTGNYMWDFSSELTEGGTGYYASVNIKFNSSGSAGADVSGFSMTFGRSND